MSILYIGDTHGYIEHFDGIERWAQTSNATAIVQVGDFGIFWPRCGARMRLYFEKRARQGKYTVPWYFCDGNHDEHDELDRLWEEAGQPDVVEVAPNCFHVRRGGVVDIDGIKHLFCGGARSTDRGRGFREFSGGDRIWWPQEAPSKADLEKFFINLETHKPEVVVTHDSPVCVDLYRDGRRGDPTALGFEQARLLSSHKPKRWYFGHHHKLQSWDVENCEIKFFCCGKHGQGWSQ